MNTNQNTTASSKSIASRFKGFLRRENGTASMEFVVMFPFFITLMGFIGDASTAFMNYNRMWDTARDTARRAAVGELSDSAAQKYAMGSLPAFMMPTVTVDNSDPVDVAVMISAPLGNLSFFGAFDAFTTGDAVVNIVMRKEI